MIWILIGVALVLMLSGAGFFAGLWLLWRLLGVVVLLAIGCLVVRFGAVVVRLMMGGH